MSKKHFSPIQPCWRNKVGRTLVGLKQAFVDLDGLGRLDFSSCDEEIEIMENYCHPDGKGSWAMSPLKLDTVVASHMFKGAREKSGYKDEFYGGEE